MSPDEGAEGSGPLIGLGGVGVFETIRVLTMRERSLAVFGRCNQFLIVFWSTQIRSHVLFFEKYYLIIAKVTKRVSIIFKVLFSQQKLSIPDFTPACHYIFFCFACFFL